MFRPYYEWSKHTVPRETAPMAKGRSSSEAHILGLPVERTKTHARRIPAPAERDPAPRGNAGRTGDPRRLEVRSLRGALLRPLFEGCFEPVRAPNQLEGSAPRQSSTFRCSDCDRWSARRERSRCWRMPSRSVSTRTHRRSRAVHLARRNDPVRDHSEERR